jgi:hypothetical protein
MDTDLIENELHKILNLTFEAASDSKNTASIIVGISFIAYKLLDKLQKDKIID